MEKINLSNYKLPQQQESKLTKWQDFALQTCKDFNLTGQYKAMIFRYAKKNLCYLQGRVANAKEKFGEEGCKRAGNYLISLFRSVPPWKK